MPLWRPVDAVGEQNLLEVVKAALEVGGAFTRKVALHKRLTDPKEDGRLVELEVPLPAERKHPSTVKANSLILYLNSNYM